LNKKKRKDKMQKEKKWNVITSLIIKLSFNRNNIIILCTIHFIINNKKRKEGIINRISSNNKESIPYIEEDIII
jgi:hypothetical protein